MPVGDLLAGSSAHLVPGVFWIPFPPGASDSGEAEPVTAAQRVERDGNAARALTCFFSQIPAPLKQL